MSFKYLDMNFKIQKANYSKLELYHNSKQKINAYLSIIVGDQAKPKNKSCGPYCNAIKKIKKIAKK